MELESAHSLKMFVSIANIWADADYSKMTHFEEWCECLKIDIERGMMKCALKDRNPDLADRIDALHKSGKKRCVAVGSLHMYTSFALPDLMEKHGCQVERIAFK